MKNSCRSRRKDEVLVKVFSPKEVEPKLYSLEKDDAIGSLADKIATDFGYSLEDNAYTLQDQCSEEVFNRNNTVKDEKVKCGDYLELVATGGGVSC